jgi:hypothetical protein
MIPKKDKYRTRNWKEYNQSLVNRGSITFWFDGDSIEKWYSTEQADGSCQSNTYFDQAIRCGLMIKAVFRIALRALQGLVQSLIKILELDYCYLRRHLCRMVDQFSLYRPYLLVSFLAEDILYIYLS